MKYIGINMHPATFTAGILHGNGDTPVVHERETSAKNLIDLANAFDDPKNLQVSKRSGPPWTAAPVDGHVPE